MHNFAGYSDKEMEWRVYEARHLKPRMGNQNMSILIVTINSHIVHWKDSI